jgi:hypothetical protein
VYTQLLVFEVSNCYYHSFSPSSPSASFSLSVKIRRHFSMYVLVFSRYETAAAHVCIIKLREQSERERERERERKKKKTRQNASMILVVVVVLTSIVGYIKEIVEHIKR